METLSEVHEEVNEDEKCPEETSAEMKTEDIVTEDSTEDIVTSTTGEEFEDVSEDKTEDLQDFDEKRTIEIRTLDPEGQNSSMTIFTLLGIGGLFAFALYKLKY